MTHTKSVLGLMAAAAIAGALIGTVATAALTSETIVKAQNSSLSTLTHEQLVWLYALEWRESRGKEKAINPKDRDNTPSYGCMQFKPGTFDYFSGLYDVATSSLMSCSEQEGIVAAMIQHRSQIDWENQFPVSVRAMGLPPKTPMSTTTP